MLKFQEKINNGNGGFYLVWHDNGVLCGELYREVDGYYVYWPSDRRGYLSAEFLRELADKLDELNKNWDEEVRIGLEAAADDAAREASEAGDSGRDY